MSEHNVKGAFDDVPTLDYLDGVIAELQDLSLDALFAKAIEVLRAQAKEIERLRVVVAQATGLVDYMGESANPTPIWKSFVEVVEAYRDSRP